MLDKGGRFVFGLLVGLLAAGILTLLLAEPRGQPVELLPLPTPAPFRVHVAGAVRSPGVYALPAGSIVSDAIDAAGGTLAGAQLDTLNLAAEVSDGQRVYLPGEGTPLPTEAKAGIPADGVVNLNTASATELESLPGIGPTLAGAIVRYREENGEFQSVEELMRVPGIGPSRMTQLRDRIRIE
jgi:competence protein ComEA